MQGAVSRDFRQKSVDYAGLYNGEAIISDKATDMNDWLTYM